MKTADEQPNYEKLRIWQEAMNFVEAVYRSTEKFPREEVFGITSQLRRASVSVPTNIAEGHGKSTKADFRRFLAISKGSLQEINTLLQIAVRVGYMKEGEYEGLRHTALSIVRQVSSLMRKIGEAE